MEHKAFNAIIVIASIVFCLLGVQGAEAAAQHISGIGITRKLHGTQAVFITESPRVLVEGVGELPICSSLRLPGSAWLTGQDAAKLAVQLSQGDGSAAAVEYDWCSGTVSSSQMNCYGGDGTYNHTVFVNLSCATKPHCYTNKDGSQACVGKK